MFTPFIDYTNLEAHLALITDVAREARTRPATALVRASYEMTNVSGKDVAIDAVFLAAQGRDLSLSLNGRSLEVREASSAGLPPEWLASGAVDPLTGEDYVVGEYRPNWVRTRAWAFSLQVPAGANAALEAAYTASLGYDRTRYKYVVRNLAYVLGPARNWAGFGTLEITASVPSRYLLASSPGLAREREVNGVALYRGTFEGVPAETIRMSTVLSAAASSPYETPVQDALTVFIPPFLVPGLVGVGVFRLFARIDLRRFTTVLAGVSAAVAAPAVTTALWLSVFPDLMSGEDLSSTYGNLMAILL